MTADRKEEQTDGRLGDEWAGRESGSDRPAEVPVWDDGYLDSVALRLLHHYDLQREYTVDGEQFELYGHLEVKHERHAIHPSLTFAHHRTEEHLFATRTTSLSTAELQRLEALGEQIADEWIDADENHYSTDITFAIIAEVLPTEVREYIDGYRNRTLLRKGYYGHYEINLIAVSPDREETVGSQEADAEQAFRVWEPVVTETPGRLSRFIDWLSR